MVDVAAVVGDVLPGLSLKYPEVEFEMGEVGTANADPTMARQVFANLLDNAFKYCATMMRPRVTLSAGEAYGEAWFQIADNGTGIGARDGARIFQPFHKGRGGAEFSGRDIGLATVKRLIDRHGGRIGFESEAGKGATFRFTFSGQHVPVQVPDAGNKAVA
jgi:signal transduction histidine kinase